ncbi:unnamed protein product [Ceratitis capitata]|uniref:(Mediterranean fruit fly) hypothetical protein n=1 Tax=Ceratitis capitata TaxID=7213 RepID=A0A811TZN5_CERCA|nr:unnamed protein product [Ceratitis capitata]
MRINFLSNLQPTLGMKTSAPASEQSTVTAPLRKSSPPSRLQRQVTIEADPDSLDSVISNPHSYPITIVPNRPASFYGYPTNGGKTFNRQASSRKLIEFKRSRSVFIKTSYSYSRRYILEVNEQAKMQNQCSDIPEEIVTDKEDPNLLSLQWKRQYMRGISATPSQAGVYYEALKGSSASLARGYVKGYCCLL